MPELHKSQRNQSIAECLFVFAKTSQVIFWKNEYVATVQSAIYRSGKPFMYVNLVSHLLTGFHTLAAQRSAYIGIKICTRRRHMTSPQWHSDNPFGGKRRSCQISKLGDNIPKHLGLLTSLPTLLLLILNMQRLTRSDRFSLLAALGAAEYQVAREEARSSLLRRDLLSASSLPFGALSLFPSFFCPHFLHKRYYYYYYYYISCVRYSHQQRLGFIW